MTEIAEFIAKIRRFNAERDWRQFHSPKNLAMALSVEVAELTEHFQWLTQAESRNLSGTKRGAVAQEIGDILIYVLNLADQLGIDPLNAAEAKLQQNQHKYPVESAKGNAKKYTEL